MAKESDIARHRRAGEIVAALRRMYPDAHCALNHKNAYELLVATILSAQCTDVRVNMVMPALMAKFPTPKAMAAASLKDIEKLIASTGFFRNKAKSLKASGEDIVTKYGGQVPATMEELTALAGVGRKTANVVLGNAYGKNVGVVVDTHVGRLSGRLGLTRHTNPVKIEQDLMKLVPQNDWTMFSHWMITHGRKVCMARKPNCAGCALLKLCPNGTKALAKK